MRQDIHRLLINILSTVLVALVAINLTACSARKSPAPVTNLSQDSSHRLKSKPLLTDVYQVKKGETLYSIAWRAGKDFRLLADINGIKSPYIIHPGQSIRLKYNENKNSKPKKKTIIKSQSTDNKQKIQRKSEKGVAKKKQQEYVQKQSSTKKQHTYRVATNKIKWMWPTQGKVTKRFSKKDNGYKGLEITNKAGTVIRSAANGVVVYAGDALRGYGQLIIVKHNDDYLSAYAHNRSLLVKEKQEVKAGQRIAEMGSSGTSDTALRFEIRYQGKSVDPVRFLPVK